MDRGPRRLVEEQFSDDQKPFTREELDALAPNHPVALQSIYRHTVLNSRAEGGEDRPGDRRSPRGKIERDAAASRRPRHRRRRRRLRRRQDPHKDMDAWLANTKKLVTYLNGMA